MVWRFSERARLVVLLAHEEARAMGHAYIGSEHILLGLVCEEKSAAARALASLGVSPEHVRAEIAGPAEDPPAGELFFTQRAKDVLEQALRKALSQRNATIGPGHILSGLMCQGDGVADRILVGLGVDEDKIRGAVLHPQHAPRPGNIDQRREALKRANQIRSRRAQLKRTLKKTQADLAELVLDPPEFLLTAKVFDFMLAIPKYGRVKVDRMLKHIGISPSKTFGGLSLRQRRELAEFLRRGLGGPASA